MEYIAIKKLIQNQKTKLKIGQITQEQYDAWKEAQMNKLGIFLSMDRITAEQYEELVELMKTAEGEE